MAALKSLLSFGKTIQEQQGQCLEYVHICKMYYYYAIHRLSLCVGYTYLG